MSTTAVHPLMEPTPTGHWTNTDRDCLRDEFRYGDSNVAIAAIDAPDFMPAGSCFSWASGLYAGQFYIQPQLHIRGEA